MAEETRITLRLPPDVYAAAKASAEKNKRSLNEEIVTVLTKYYDVVDDMVKRIEELERFIATLKSAPPPLLH